MPVAFTIYTILAGLGVGPLGELTHFARIVMLIAQIFKVKPKKLPFVIASTQALIFIPSLLWFLLHRALPSRSPNNPATDTHFAGQMVLLDTDTNFLEYVDMEGWEMQKHFSFHLNVGSLDIAVVPNVTAEISREKRVNFADNRVWNIARRSYRKTRTLLPALSAF